MLKNLRTNWQILLILLLGISIAWPLFYQGYFSHHDDLQVIRIFEMRRCLEDWQVPCRWVPDMGYGNGFPLYNYYGPFPYYLGGLLSFFLSYINSAKVLFFLTLVLGGIGMYLLVRRFWGATAGLVSGVLYIFAPYKALDVYVRGALSEAFALALIPFVFLFGYKLVKSKSVANFLAFSLSLAAFLTTHNIMTIIFVPALVLWLGLVLFLDKGRRLRTVLLGLILAVGLSAFFVIPAFVEKSLIQTETLTRYGLDFRANFVTLKQLFFDRLWNYEASAISLQIGWPLWWLAVLAPAAVFFRRSDHRTRAVTVFFSTLFAFSIFMTHNKSAFIWERIDILKYFQFPWRFLSLTIFSASILGGAFVQISRKKFKIVVGLAIVVITVILNWGYFRPGEFYTTLTDKDLLSGQRWEIQQKGALLDYLPKTALEPEEKAPETPEAKKGTAAVYDFENHSNWWKFTTVAETQSYIEVPVFYFPGWKAKIDGEDTTINYENYLGRIGIIADTGVHRIEGRFFDTPLRKFSNILTAGSLLALVLIVLYEKTRKIYT
jgi:hypothetical protein